MHLKSIFYLSAVAAVYTLLFILVPGGFGVLGIYILLGFLITLGTMNIAHDALHGAYFSRQPGNRLLGCMMDLCGASSFFWKKEHTVDHHTFTNIAEHDADLDVPILLRLCPKAPYRSFHRFQHFYAPFLYCMNLLHWVYFSDIKRIFKISKRNAMLARPSVFETGLFFFFKVVHVGLFIVLPIAMLPIPWWQIVLGYIAFQAVGGITITTVFQLAHIVENVAFPLPNAEGKINDGFAQHQLATTSNFATKSRFVHFLFGGLNFQIEHHLFPQICHMHLRKISPIVREAAREFGLPYNENSSFIKALRSHFRTLKKLGKNPPVFSN